MVHRLFDAKSLPEQMLINCKWDFKNKLSEIPTTIQTFLLRQLHLKCCLQNGSHFFRHLSWWCVNNHRLLIMILMGTNMGVGWICISFIVVYGKYVDFMQIPQPPNAR